MPRESAQKGRTLEKAVQLIQEAILESDPQTKGIEFSIETNRWVTVSGVRHEIDVWVKTLPGSKDYQATWIFECKNWQKPVDKNAVIVFAEKVEAVQANRGFLVAKAFSSDAEAQLALKPRLKSILCTEDFLSPFNTAELVHLVHDVLPPTVLVEFYGRHSENAQKRLDPKTVPCHLNGRHVDFLRFMNSKIDEIAAEERKVHFMRFNNEGTHWGQVERVVAFDLGAFSLDGKDVRSVTIPLFYFVTSCRKRILSRFELKGRGQVFAFEPLEGAASGKPIEVHLVTTFDQTQRGNV